jgi:hypothetical protein
MQGLEDFEEHETTPRVRVGVNVQVRPACPDAWHQYSEASLD